MLRVLNCTFLFTLLLQYAFPRLKSVVGYDWVVKGYFLCNTIKRLGSRIGRVLNNSQQFLSLISRTAESNTVERTRTLHLILIHRVRPKL